MKVNATSGVDIGFAVGIGILFILFLRHAFGTDGSFALFQDNEDMLGPLLSVLSGAVRSGVWPLRTDTFMGGMSLYDLPQLSAFYPFYLVWLPIFRSPFESIYAIHWLVLMHMLIMTINMCILLRVIGVSRKSALLGAILFTFSANNYIYAAWVNILAPYAWLPLYLAGIIAILNQRKDLRFFLATIVGMVLLVLASPAQPLIHAVLMTAVFCVAKLFQAWRSREAMQWKLSPLITIGFIGIASVLIVSPVLLPALWNLKGMIRWIGAFPALIGNARIPFEAFQTDQLTVRELGGAFFKIKDLAVGQQYVGVFPFALMLVAIVSRWRSWLVQALTFVALYALVSSAGANLGLAYLNYHLPLLNKIREPSRFLVLFQLAVAMLASMGLDEICSVVAGREDSRRARVKFIALVVTIVAAAIVAVVIRHEIVSRFPPVFYVGALCILSLLTWIASRKPSRKRGLIVSTAWVGMALALLALEIRWVPHAVSESNYLSSNGPALDLALSRVVTLDPSRDYRVIFGGKINRQHAAMLASYRGIRTLNGYINPAPYRQFSEVYFHVPRADNSYFALGANFLICDVCDQAAVAGYKFLEEVGGYRIFRADQALPHAYTAVSSLGEYHTIDQFKDLTKDVKLSDGVFLDANESLRLPQAGGTPPTCISTERSRSVSYERFETVCSSGRVQVLNEFFDRGWRGYVDGSRVEIFQVNGNQMGIFLKPGAHIVEFKYTPTIFKASLFLSALGICLVGLYIVRHRRSQATES
ncbi:YfhO family protein [Paraburkholderia hospita]|uniref:YfhO family protein n=1 Tax=Paraburkholderia hospita TaxID=169430 RepID=UPI000B349C09|nr:YfhO family protein [Paraburkholderia hospita]OUL82339.1 hypothetical protein CA603_28500 [Paraburkholderia hospita]